MPLAKCKVLQINLKWYICVKNPFNYAEFPCGCVAEIPAGIKVSWVLMPGLRISRLAMLKSCDTTKQSVCGWEYICVCMSLSSSSHARISLLIHLYHPSLPVGIPNYILCLHRADVNKFSVVTPTCVGVVCPCISSSVPHVLLSYLDSFWDGGQMAIQLLFCGLLHSGYV